jgi:hypothetical protein
MAKLRRIIRKVNIAVGDSFDEQIWPVYIALVVLGGFLMGISAAYLKFSNTPWYANAITSLVAIPLVVGGFMVAFSFIDNRTIRRSMQFSIVLCAILHVALVVQMLQTRILGGFFQKPVAQREIIQQRPPKIIPEYHPQQMLPEESRPRQDFEKPVETETPQPSPKPEEIVRQDPQEPKETSPPEPQPVPVEQPQPTPRPNIINKPQPNEITPRQADQPSKLSRQLKPSEIKVSQVVDTPKPVVQKTSAPEAKPSAAPVERQTSEATASRTPAPAEPTVTQEHPTTQIAKRAESQTPQANASATPTLKRQIAQPTVTPRAQVATADAPSPTQRTSPAEVTPANTSATKRTTTSPEIARATSEPTTEVTPKVATKPQRSEQPAQEAPTVASTPTPVPNRQPRATARPDVSTAATKIAASPSANPATSQTAQLAPQKSTVAKATNQVTATRPSAVPSAEPASPHVNQPAARIAKSQAKENPSLQQNPTARPTLTRRAAAVASLPNVTRVDVAPAAATTVAASGVVSPASTATRRQPTTAAQAAPSAGEPQPAQTASSATTPSAAPLRRAVAAATNGAAAVAAPSNSNSPATSRSTANASANVVTTVGDVPTNTGPQATAGATPGPASASIARQTAPSSPRATRTQAALDVPSASPSAQLARGGATRATPSPAPTIDTSAATSGSPARAVATAATASSPVAVESPTAAVAAQGTGDPSAQPARMSLSKSLAGTAGVGRSPNFDRSLPGGNSPAMVASGAADRAEATQNTPTGDALSPSAPAQIARSQAGANLPSASLKAEPVDFASTAGGAEISQLTASSSAALTRSDASAVQGEVTGAKGEAEVDVGTTQLVAETGSGRAAGGGQQTLNFETQSPELARAAAAGGAPEMSLVATKVAEVAAPLGTAGGQPAAAEAGPAAVAATRTNAGGEASISGGPSSAAERGPVAEVNSATLVADATLSRADNAEGSAGGPAAGGDPGDEDEEEKARRLARAAMGGAPQLALAGPTLADLPATPMGDAGDGGAPNASTNATAVALSTGRQYLDGGAPRGGAPIEAGDLGEASGASAAAEVGSIAITKAEATDGAPGAPAVGGGTASPALSAAGPLLAASTQAETVELAGAPASGGEAKGTPLEAQGVAAGRLAGGAAGPTTNGPVGAMAGEEIVAASSPGLPGSGVGKRQTSPSLAEGPAISDVANNGGPQRRSGGTYIPAGGATVADIPQVGPTSAVAQAELDHLMGGVGSSPMARQNTGNALAVNLAAPEGPGGIGSDFTPEVGLNDRRARSDSVEVSVRAARFVKQQAGGLPNISTAVVVATDSFTRRAARTRGDQIGGGKGAPPPQTEEIVEMGLAFLARYQLPGGGWSLQGFNEETALASDTGATALAVLSFQGAGYNHREHQYKDVVRGGIDYLLQGQKESGDLFVPLDDNSNRSVWLYSHALATIAICEAYGMTQDPDLKEPAQKAIDFIVAAQDPQRGGWRYTPQIGGDTSVTGWMMMALKSAELAKLDVPVETYQKIQIWLDAAEKSRVEPFLYRYNPQAPDTYEQRQGRIASKTMTAVGLLMRQYSGWRRDNQNMLHGAEYLKQNLPSLGTPREPQRDTYYWYYATQVMFHMGGDYWAQWNAHLHPLLINSQLKRGPLAGSWEPRGAIPDRWGPHAGRLYVTTMNLLSLEVWYRHLPLYEDTAQ